MNSYSGVIKTLKDDEVFVFGANSEGFSGVGAAGYATFGEMGNDPNYGCAIWENDFDNLTSNNKIREQIKQSLLKAINQYETRIQNVKIDVLIKQEEQRTVLTGRHVKKMLHINVQALLVSTRESIKYNDQYFTGPLSYE